MFVGAKEATVGGTGVCELFDMSPRNQTKVLCKKQILLTSKLLPSLTVFILHTQTSFLPPFSPNTVKTIIYTTFTFYNIVQAIWKLLTQEHVSRSHGSSPPLYVKE